MSVSDIFDSQHTSCREYPSVEGLSRSVSEMLYQATKGVCQH